MLRKLSARQKVCFEKWLNAITYCSPHNSSAMVVLLAIIKTATSLLLKTSLQFHLMLTVGVEGLYWPNDCQERGKWMQEKMTALVKQSEEILVKCT